MIKLSSLLIGGLVLSWAGAANAETFNFSNLTGVSAGSGRYNWDQGSTEIFTYTGSQVNPWTLGTDGSAATINFNGGGFGNNAGKIYIPTGAPDFPLPSGTTLGTNNNYYTGDYAQANGFPLYFWFSQPGNASVGATVNDLDSLFLADATAGLTITGYGGLPNALGPALDTFTLTSAIGVTPAQIVLDWTGIDTLEISGATGFYVNDVEVNDLVATPILGSVWLLGLPLMGMLGFGWRRRKATVSCL